MYIIDNEIDEEDDDSANGDDGNTGRGVRNYWDRKQRETVRPYL
jgi:hypothetical protein